MEDLHLKLGELPQSTLAACHSLLLGAQQPHHHHHLNHLQLNQQLSQLNQLSQLTQLHHRLQQQLNLSSGLNLNLGFVPKLAAGGSHQMQHLSHRMQMGLGLDLDLDLSMNLDLNLNLEGSSSNASNASSASKVNELRQGHGSGMGSGLNGLKGAQPQVHYAHDPAQDNGDSLSVRGRCGSPKNKESEAKTEGDSLAASNDNDKSLPGGSDKEIAVKLSASTLLKAANSKLNAFATPYTMRSKGQILDSEAPVSKSSHSEDFRVNARAAEFKPSLLSVGGLLNLPGVCETLLPVASQPLLPTPYPLNHLLLDQAHQSVQRSGVKQNSRWRKQPLPDLLSAVLELVKELSRSVSYPEIINVLALRLRRPEVELKRHMPHILHDAVINGYLKKEGNRYTLVSEAEQKEIMRRNQEAAKRAKELEKEPLSWRKR
ncbi:LOW QUALITY PROTEIN: uncharacterized protein LOC108091285 [Drosophila ficusphila]|uniref:LOW QUALITY PROTEIN: uncharacterized protein LOC108091285 n=1 Tax=Drosophila ficusphila TaxID=30025 RepID=UPI0007E89BBD|nr:LOW QUALITY PROTEIN: uncharacterized protein LOC108091285 [Drosophila ficusphila]